MAGDWIKWVKGLVDRREVVVIAQALSMDRRMVAGCLMQLWEWADDNVDFSVHVVSEICPQSVRGLSETCPETVHEESAFCHLPFLEPSFVDELLCVDGFADAMIKAGWLHHSDAGLTFPNAERHNGKSAKKRAIDNIRKQMDREKSSETSRTKTGRASDKSRTRRGQKTDKPRTREEKRREENKKEENPPPPLVFPASIDAEECKEAWAKWIQYKREIKDSYKSRTSEQEMINRLAPMGKDKFVQAINHSIARGWKGIFPDKDDEKTPLEERTL